MEKLPISPINPCAMALHVTPPSRKIAIRIIYKNLILNSMRSIFYGKLGFKISLDFIKIFFEYFLQKIIKLHFFTKNVVCLCREQLIPTRTMINTTTLKTFEKSLLKDKPFINQTKFDKTIEKQGKRQVDYTTMKIDEDEDGRPYAQYVELKDALKRYSKATSKAAKFLTKYKLFLDDESNRIYYIYRIFHQYKKGEPLESPGEVNLAKYIKEVQSSGDLFVENEIELIKDLHDNFDPEKTVFIPFPQFEGGELQGIFKIIYNIEAVDQSQRNKFLAKINR